MRRRHGDRNRTRASPRRCAGDGKGSVPEVCLGTYASREEAEDAAQLHAAEQVFKTGEAAIFRFRYERAE